ncbi:ABC transporter permease, partial [bacterium]|nr:ABC transporter permease [bacterium]
MNLLESLRIAIRALGANKVRSVLTMLGVIIGVAAVILLVAIGTGVQTEITGTIEGLGSNLIFAFPGNMEQGGGGGGGPAGSITKQFTLDDAELVQRRLGSDHQVVPLIQGSAVLKVGNREMRTTIAAANEFGDEVF